jgi:hypothetical protein
MRRRFVARDSFFRNRSNPNDEPARGVLVAQPTDESEMTACDVSVAAAELAERIDPEPVVWRGS